MERMARLMLVLLAVSASVLVVNATPDRPRIPFEFSADFGFFMNINDGVPFAMDGTYQVDAFAKGMRWELQDPQLPGYYVNMTNIMGDGYGYSLSNGVCRIYDSTEYFPMFFFVPMADYVGTAPLNGTDCDTWAYISGESSFSVSVLSSDVTRPVTVVYDLSWGTGSLYESFTFPIDGMWLPNDVEPWAFDVPERCYSEGSVCPGGDVETLEMVRFHAADDYDITNKNTADYLGDTTFLCTGLETQNKNQIISLYDVEVNTQWGQYALCNNDECVGGRNDTVGHEASFGLMPMGGQCRKDSAYGNWYSLTGVSRCNGTASVSNSTEGCAWKQLDLKKSITLDCLVSVGFGAACEEDAFTLPFAAATQSLYNALNYDSAADGGCPNMYNTTTGTTIDDFQRNGSDDALWPSMHLIDARERVYSALKITSKQLRSHL